VKCFNCEGDHCIGDCPELKRNKANNADDVNMAAAMFEATTFVTYQVNAVHYSGFKLSEVLLDNQANISVLKPGMLRHIEPAKEEVNICGVGGLQLRVKETGYLNEFFRVYASEDTRANVLSFANVEDLYDITYVRGESFVVHLPSRDLEFARRGKLYVADFTKEGLVHATQVVTKGEEARAEKAYKLVKNLGFPSMYEVIQIVESGSVEKMPLLTRDDVRCAYELYGLRVGFVRRKTTRRQARFAVPDDDLILDQKKQVLSADIMHLDSYKYLMSVSQPLQLTLQMPVAHESQMALGMALQSQLEVYRSRVFQPVRVYVNPQSTFRSLTTKYPGVVIDPSGAGDHVPKVDAKIRRGSLPRGKGRSTVEITAGLSKRFGCLLCCTAKCAIYLSNQPACGT
jgi:hypothetical protein